MPERFLAARISAPGEPAPRIWGSANSTKDGEYVRAFGDRVSEEDRLLDRRAGLEQEFFLVENSGHPSERADEFLEAAARSPAVLCASSPSSYWA